MANSLRRARPGGGRVVSHADRQDAHDPRAGPTRGTGRSRDGRDHVVADGGGPGHPQHRPVGLLSGQVQHQRRQRGQQHRHPARPGRGQADVRAQRAAIDVDRGTVQQRQQDRQVFAHVPGGPVEAVPVHVLDDDLVRQADAEHQPAGADRPPGRRPPSSEGTLPTCSSWLHWVRNARRPGQQPASSWAYIRICRITALPCVPISRLLVPYDGDGVATRKCQRHRLLSNM